ncbi:Zinc finger CCCH domain-containing protein 32 [Acorus calamus]|uniref:Zinc finger CCCH domain-containing protein 32 n=1 Tax=Acorus calamus TaxID=4465 RepID=A0AAV9DU97_ACOCL|nr:Zinc finger CCCH domain-containing protein 32 [Acorus calamus]
MDLTGREPSTRLPTSQDEEAVKKNTDCVYFLASPLTCKKGNECEYRHSENARMNPRDCYFWLTSNCLNPKCGFRHPPLEGPVGAPLSTSSGAAFPLVQAAPPAQLHAVNVPASYNPNKQNIPCIFFQKGGCLKGDKCSFMHGSQPISNPVPQQSSKMAAPTPEQPQAHNKPATFVRCSSQQKFPQASIDKFVQVLPTAQSVIKSESLPVGGLAAKKNTPIPPLDEENPRIKQSHVPVVSNISASRIASHHAPPLDVRFPNGRAVNEFRAKTSAGLDVLVDHGIRETKHFHVVDDTGRERNHHERSKSSKLERERSSDYDSLPSSKREMYAVRKDNDQYGRLNNQFSLVQHRPSSERILERAPVPERRRFHREESRDRIDQSDLRHRLTKKMKFNGLRSTVSPDRRGEYYRGDDRRDEEQGVRGHSFLDRRPPSAYEGPIKNRLQGRIKLPVENSVENSTDDSIDSGRMRSRGRVSPPSRTIVSHQGRQHDRIKRRAHEELSKEGRNSAGHSIGTDDINFAPPKRLTDLKGTKASNSARSTNLTDGLAKPLGHQEPEGSLSFEGPKPLSMILKRKRGEAPENSVVGTSEATEFEKDAPHTSSDAGKTDARAAEEEEKEEGLILTDGEVHHDVYSPASKAEDDQGMGDSEMVNRMEDPDFEAYEQGEGEFDYEQVEGEEDVDANHEGEYLDDEDDEDDFAKKVGITLS